MKKMLMVGAIILTTLCVASADRMSVGAGFYEGAASYGSLACLIGGYFQYELTDWLAGRAMLGNISMKQHLDNEVTTTVQGETGLLIENNTMDATTNSLPYISAQLLAYVPISDGGRFYIGPGFFIATLRGKGRLEYNASYSDVGYKWNYDHTVDLEIKKQTLTGMTIVLGGSIDISDQFFVFGETLLLGSYQGDYDYNMEHTTTGSDYPVPFIMTQEEMGRVNYGVATMGLGLGMYF